VIEPLKIQGKDELDVRYILAIKINELIEAVNKLTEPFEEKYGMEINGKWTSLKYLPHNINELNKLLKPKDTEKCQHEWYFRSDNRVCIKCFKKEPKEPDTVGVGEIENIIANYCSRKGFTEYTDCAKALLDKYDVRRKR